MFNSPPSHKMVQTRGAKEKEKQEQSAKEGHSGTAHDARSEGIKGGSLKIEAGCHKSIVASKKGSMVSRKKSFEVRKKRLQLEAAEAIAKIQMDIIEKKLAADIAALKEKCSQKSRESCDKSSVVVSQKVEQWLEHSQQDVKEPLRAGALSPRKHCTDKFRNAAAVVLLSTTHILPGITPPTDFQQLAQALKDIAIAATSNALNAKMLSRLCTPRDLLMSLYGIMLRFRENKITISADITNHFLRVKIIPEDQDAQRRDNPGDPVKTYAMTSLIFGANCSPFIAQFIMNKNSVRFQPTMPTVVHAICKQHYAEDIVYIHSQGGFEIRNWTISNCTAVLDCLPKESLGTSAVKFKMDQQDEGERTLGLIWFPKEDCLGFDVSFKRIPENIINGTTRPTKREMLRVIMSIFDVYGFLSPFTIKGKIMLQDTWRSDVQWDDVIPNSIFDKWLEWLQILKDIGSLRLPRYYQMSMGGSKNEDALNALNSSEHIPASPPPPPPPPLSPPVSADMRTIMTAGYTNLQLHIFCDASTQAMSAVAYWRWENNGIRTAFITSECRVAVLKHMSVPRLELQAALLAARLADTIQKEHKMDKGREALASGRPYGRGSEWMKRRACEGG